MKTFFPSPFAIYAMIVVALSITAGNGYGAERLAMDLNPDVASRVDAEVQVFVHDCAETWPIEDSSLDVVFTSNFFEHLPTKGELRKTISEATSPPSFPPMPSATTKRASSSPFRDSPRRMT